MGCTVYVLNAGKLHIIFKSLKKTDKEDALRIAKFIQRIPEEELPTVIIPGGEEMAMRSSATELIRLDRTRTQSINALHSLLVIPVPPDHGWWGRSVLIHSNTMRIWDMLLLHIPYILLKASGLKSLKDAKWLVKIL